MGDLSSVYIMYYKMICHDTHMIVHSRIYVIYTLGLYIIIYLHTGKKYDRMWLMIIVHDTY